MEGFEGHARAMEARLTPPAASTLKNRARLVKRKSVAAKQK
jgi:hypothetical protein